MGLFYPAPGFSASQKMVEVARYGDFERGLSTNEIMLLQFESERKELMRYGRKKEKNPRILKNRLKILNNKIEYLQREIKYRPAQPVPAKPAHAAPNAVSPVQVDFRPAAVSEARAGFQRMPAPAKPRPPKTGADWKQMSRSDKEIYILSLMGNLSRRDVYLMKPYNYYIDMIDQAVEKNPSLKKEFVHHILMMTAYENEPDTRKDLEKVWK